MDRELCHQAMLDAIVRGKARSGGFWLALRDQDLLALEGFFAEDPAWCLAQREGATGRTPWEACAFLHRHDALAALCAHGADVDAGAMESSPLAQAARSGCSECLDILIQAGANLDAEDALGQTPLVAAALAKAERVSARSMSRLLAAGAKPDVVTSNGCFALGACAQCDHAADVEIMAKAKADMDLHAGDGFTALFYAVDNGAREAAEALLRAGAGFEGRAQWEGRLSSPLDVASAKGDTGMAAMLFSFGEAQALRERIGAGARPARARARL